MCCIHPSLESILSYICNDFQQFVKLLRNKHAACNNTACKFRSVLRVEAKLCGHVRQPPAVPPHPSHPRGFLARVSGVAAPVATSHHAVPPLHKSQFPRARIPVSRKLLGKCFGSRSHEVTFAALVAEYRASPLAFAIFGGVAGFLRNSLPAVQSSVDSTSADVTIRGHQDLHEYLPGCTAAP